jgi:hypothetical protein
MSRGWGLDGTWHWLKANTFGVTAQHGEALDKHIHEAQWWHWAGAEDRWVASGNVLAFVPWGGKGIHTPWPAWLFHMNVILAYWQNRRAAKSSALQPCDTVKPMLDRSVSVVLVGFVEAHLSSRGPFQSIVRIRSLVENKKTRKN